MCHEVALEFFATNTPDLTPLDPKLMFWCVSYCLRAFGTVKLPYKTRGKTFRTSAKVRATTLRRIISQRTYPIHPLDPKLIFWCVSYRLRAFGTVKLPYKTWGKTFRTSAKVRATMLRGIISQRTCHWTLNSCFGAFHTILLHLEQFGCLTKLVAKQAEQAKVCATK